MGIIKYNYIITIHAFITNKIECQIHTVITVIKLGN